MQKHTPTIYKNKRKNNKGGRKRTMGCLLGSVSLKSLTKPYTDHPFERGKTSEK